MSNNIDEKVVAMQFDNSNFEKNVHTSMSTLEKLKASLDMTESEQSLSTLSQTANSISFGGIESAVQSLSDRFSTMGIVGMTVLQNITSTVTSAVTSIASKVKSMVVDGGITRALNIEQAKFQLSGLGIAWEDIEDDINYGVKDTAYGLDVAAKAASVLSASGVKIGTEMKTSLRAISGVAAMTNSDYDSIAQIFETVAGQGKLMTQQLRMLESRGLNAAATIGKQIGKTETQVREMVSDGEINFETFATAMDDAFGEHAKDANKTFDGAMSNVQAALARIGAKFATPGLESLRQIFVALIPVIDNVSSSLNSFVSFAEKSMTSISNEVQRALGYIELLQNGNTLDSLADDDNLKKISKNTVNLVDALFSLFNTVKNIGKGIVSFIKPIVVEFGSIFGSGITAGIFNVSKKLETLSESFHLTEKGAMYVYTILEDLFTKIKSAWSNVLTGFLNIWKAIGTVLSPIKKAFNEVFSDLFDDETLLTIGFKIGNIIESLAEGFSSLTKTLGLTKEQQESVNQGFTVFFKFIKDGIEYIKTFGGRVESWHEAFSKLSVKLKEFSENLKNSFSDKGIDTSKFEKFVEKLKNALDPIDVIVTIIVGILEGLGKIASAVVPYVTQAFSSIGTSVKKFFSSVKDAVFNSDSEKAMNILEGGMFATFLYVAKSLASTLMGFINAFKPSVSNVLNQIKDTLVAWEKDIKVNMLIKTAGALALLAVSCLVLSGIDTDKLEDVTGVLLVLMTGITTVVAALSGVIYYFNSTSKAFKKGQKTISGALSNMFNSFGEANKLNAVGNTILKMAGSVLILAIAVKMLSSIDATSMWSSVAAITVLLVALAGVAVMMSKLNTDGEKSVKGLMSLAIAVDLLAVAVKTLGGMPLSDLAKGVGSVVILLASLMGICIGLSKLSDSGTIKSVGSLISLAIAVDLLAAAVKTIGSMDTASVIQGTVAITSLLTIIGAFCTAMQKLKVKDIAKISSSLMSFSVGIAIMAISMKVLGTIGWDGILQGITSIASLFAIIGLFSKYADTLSNMSKTASSLIIFSSAIAILSVAMKVMSSIEFDAAGTAILAIASLITIFGIFATVAQNIQGLTSVAASLVIFAAAIAILVPPLVLLSSIPITNLFTAILSLAAVIAVLGVSATALQPVMPAIIALAGALALIGAACALAGVGLLAVGAGLTAIAAAVAASGGAIVAFVTSLFSLIPTLILKIGEGITLLLQLFIDSAPLILSAVETLITVLLQAVTNTMPKLSATLMLLLTTILNILVSASQLISDAIFTIIETVLSTISENIYQIVDLASEIIIQFLEGIADNLPDIIQAGVDVIIAFLDGIGNSIEQISDAGFDLIIDFIDGISDSIEKNHDKLHDSIVNLIETICTTAIDEMSGLPGDFLKIGEDVLSGLIDGFNNMIKDVGDSIASVGSTIISKAKKVLDINSPSKEFFLIGTYTMMGLINAIISHKDKVASATETVAQNALSSMQNSLANLSSVINNGIDSEPVIRPIIDMNNIEDGINTIDGMFESSSFSLLSTVGGISQMMQNRQNKSTNEDVVNAILGLRRSIEDNPRSVTTIGDISYSNDDSVDNAIETLINAVIVGRRA